MHFLIVLLPLTALLVTSTVKASATPSSPSSAKKKANRLSVPHAKSRGHLRAHTPATSSDSESESSQAPREGPEEAKHDVGWAEKYQHSHSPIFPMDLHHSSSHPHDDSTTSNPSISTSSKRRKTSLQRRRRMMGRTRSAPGDFLVGGRKMSEQSRRSRFIPFPGSRRGDWAGGQWNTLVHVQVSGDESGGGESEGGVGKEKMEIAQTLPDVIVCDSPGSSM